MKKIIAFAAVLGAAALMMSCGTYRSASVVDVRTGPYFNVPGATGVVGSKTGEASSTAILGIYASGDDSITAAAKAGGIKTIGTISKKQQGYFGVYNKTTTVVTGD
jgi:hypothetical protein